MKREEWERRYTSYKAGGTIKEMAARCNLPHGTFAKWLYDNGLKVKNKRIGGLSIKLSGVSPYLHKRPRHEVERMRHFEAKLLQVADSLPKQWDGSIGNFVEEYADLYGGEMNEQEA